ncbi:hypothetical protein OM076_43280 [Solirubrobacter ginsenosidimutans]|uniref:Uncharacterized protein n=1 Tax=Solirubrobacter ginsenosidimutans TaxID=490573 RepID=A0A9X3S6S8_9ACTN|nr:hypothetical protein [Solirubrobacter ginsenosidimutans]MDA0167162.1 hypothetical protein [Solirubrobacter ginsenosidimutans]
MVEHASYYALRRRPGATADAWWTTVRWRRDVPKALFPIVAGRARVEVTQDEVVEALDWAERFDGADALAVYPRDPRAVVRTSA